MGNDSREKKGLGFFQLLAFNKNKIEDTWLMKQKAILQAMLS